MQLNVYGIYFQQKLIAVFNVYIYSKIGLKNLIPPPFSPTCSLLFDSSVVAENRIEAINQIVLFFKDKKFSYLSIPFSFQYNLPDTISGFYQNKHQTYVLELTSTKDVFDLYHPKRRQQIRRAEKDLIFVKQELDMNIVFDLVCKTFERQKKSINKTLIKKILFEFSNSQNSFAFTSYQNDNPLNAYFCIYDNHCAYYLLGGYNEKIKHIGAGPLAMHACIKHTKELGIPFFDFEGSMIPSIEKYFKEFGGIKKEYFSFEKKSISSKVIGSIKTIVKK
jgi:hypothetical protein